MSLSGAIDAPSRELEPTLSAFRVEWRPLAELAAVGADWRALAARVLAPNVFYEPGFALAAAPVFGRGVGAGLVWSQAMPPQLLGLFPARVERFRHGMPVLVGWTHPYAPLGAPLVDRELSEPVIAAWFAHVAGDPQLPGLILLPCFPAEGELAQALAAVLARRGGRSAAFARHQRALLLPSGDRAHYFDEAIGGKKRKELRRQRKRLAERGVVTSGSAPVGPALEQFFALEAGGWKGRVGTAARENAAIAGFVTAALTAFAGEGKAKISLLRVDARPIAALVTLRSGASAWCWKIAYDESFARFSPGVQLLLDVTHMLLDDPAVARVDSCATADHPMIDHIWRERLALEDRLLCVGPDKSFGFACALEALRRALIGAAKATRDAVRS